MLNYKRLPENLQNAARLWIEQGIFPGGFTSCLLVNDLRGTILLADQRSLDLLPEIFAFWLNEAPDACFGSRKKVNEWFSHHGLKGVMASPYLTLHRGGKALPN